MILNARFPFIRTQLVSSYSIEPSIEYRTDTYIWQLRDFNDGRDYLYFEVFTGNAFDHYPIRSLVSADILDRVCTDDKTFLYIVNSHEAFTEELIYPLYNNLVLKENIPARKIIIANEAADLQLTARECADVNNGECFITEWVRMFEGSVSQAGHRSDFLENIMLDINNTYDKRYLCFNRRWRTHRPLIVALLKASSLLDRGYVSLAPSDDNKNWKEFYPMLKFQHSNNSKITEMLESIEDELIHMEPLYLDFNDLTVNLPEVMEESKYLYQNSLVSIVTETNFYSNTRHNSSRFLSEKIFKPIIFGHPFILASVPCSLELLRTLGYKTFHPYIDESYDTETDDCERVLKIIQEIKKICEYDDEQVKEFINNVKPIVEYNRELLLSKSRPIYDGTDYTALRRNFITK